MCVLSWITSILVIVGALNWGLVGFFDFNLVEAIFGVGALSRVIYAVVGLAGLYAIVLLGRHCGKGCCKDQCRKD